MIDISHDDTVVKALKKDPAHDQEEALKDIYRKLRPGDPPTVANARALLKRLFFDPKKYDLGRVGRYKINQKLGIDVDLGERILTDKDFIAAIKYLINLRRGEGTLDDIDHLGSRRVRTVGELLANQCRVGLARTERLVKERMTLFDINIDGMTPQKLINPKALQRGHARFLRSLAALAVHGSDNPLAELTHKRRLSALGPGGLCRDRAGFEVRDVHPSHYGRICPIETPEGPNIGLISSMSTFARINEFGFIETPYRKVENGRVTDQVDYLTGDREENFIVAQANAPMDAKGHFTGRKGFCPLSWRLSGSRTGQGPLHGRLAEAAGLGCGGFDSVPRARRREPRVDGFEHATPGRAVDRFRSAARRHRARRQSGARLARRCGRDRSGQGRLRHRRSNRRHRRMARCRKAARR